MYTKQDYEASLPQLEKLRKLVKEDEYRLGFHIMPATGWLNDPNGLCQFQHVNHIYFQYTPQSATWGMKSWGHYTTKNWIHYQEEEPFLFADHEADRDGVYSGSAFVEDNQLYYFYTGNVKYEDKAYDYINTGREQNTMLVTSKDGYHYGQKELLLQNVDYPSTMSLHVRDPKIYKKDGKYYMVLGARSKQDVGCVLLYESENLHQWNYHMCIESDIAFGYMWECPDLFDIDGKTFLVCCPQGVKQDGINYANVYQFGYFEIALDLQNKTYTLSSFHELDRGFDIYAPQSFEDEQGRRILIAWMGIPDATYHNEETIQHGWQHALTMPRQLCVRNDILVQQPLEEFKQLRLDEASFSMFNTFEIEGKERYECRMEFRTCKQFLLKLKADIQLQYQDKILTLSMEESGSGRDKRSVALQNITSLHVFMDTSCIEIFVNDGEEVFTSRYYTRKQTPISMFGEFEGSTSLYTLGVFELQELGGNHGDCI